MDQEQNRSEAEVDPNTRTNEPALTPLDEDALASIVGGEGVDIRIGFPSC